jgi:hypothetical protein
MRDFRRYFSCRGHLRGARWLARQLVQDCRCGGTSRPRRPLYGSQGTPLSLRESVRRGRARRLDTRGAESLAHAEGRRHRYGITRFTKPPAMKLALFSTVTSSGVSIHTSNSLLRWPFRHQSSHHLSGFVTVDVAFLSTGHESFSPRPIKRYCASTSSSGIKMDANVSDSVAQIACNLTPKLRSSPTEYRWAAYLAPSVPRFLTP